MTINKKETRVYEKVDKYGKMASYLVTYSLVFFSGVLRNVFNEFGNSIEKNSECWDFFNHKYNN